MIERLRVHLWRWWSQLRARVAATREERAIRVISRAMDTTDWHEYEVSVDAACYADQFLMETGLATGDEKADEKAAWELGRRLLRLHAGSQHRKGARAP